MKIIKFFEKRRKKINREIANEVYELLSSGNGWEKFLPPVVVRDVVYMVTENGSIYAMKNDNGFEQIIQIIRR